MADERMTGGRAGADDNPEATTADVDRAAANVRGQLEERDIRVHDDESPPELADLLSAVEDFEGAVRAQGGDSYTNTPQSSRPGRAEFVIPTRGDDETASAYERRIRAAAERIAPGSSGSDAVRRHPDPTP